MADDCNICSTKCFGINDYHGSCCSLEDRDYIIGPHYDTVEFLDRLTKRFGRIIKYSEVFVDWSEGRKMFPDKSVWQNSNNYPALRIEENDSRLPCTFYNTKIKACTVHAIRPQVCRDYECDYLKQETNK